MRDNQDANGVDLHLCSGLPTEDASPFVQIWDTKSGSRLVLRGNPASDVWGRAPSSPQRQFPDDRV